MTTISSDVPAPTTGARGFWPMRDLPVVLWLVATVASTMVHPFVPAPRWLMIHLLLLGAVGHAILVWSRYFADTLLRVEPTPRREQERRLASYNVGVVVVVTGVLGDWWVLVLVGALAIAAAVLDHGASLWRQLRSAMSGRFAVTVRYYMAAAMLLPVGIGLGVWMARGLSDPLATQLRTAHVVINVLGWVGLTVLGTLLSLWPTMLRTRIVEGAERLTGRALPLLLGAIGLTVLGALFDRAALIPVGLGSYLAGVLLLAVPLARAARVKPPTAFPTWSMAAGFLWLIGCLIAMVVLTARAGDWGEMESALGVVTPYLAAGFVAQVLLGASSYLLPVVRGGGPVAVRAGNRAFDSAAPLRIVVTNGGLLMCVLPVPSAVRVVVSLVVLVALASFVPLVFRALRAARTATPPEGPRTGPMDPAGDRPAGQRKGLVAAGVAVLLVAVAAGAAWDPASVGQRASSAAAGVAATGTVTEVTVVAKGMRFEPASVTVPAGNELVITLRNESSGDVHDLVLDNGAKSGRISPGEEATFDVGVVGRALDGWCSVVGHRQMGMVFAVKVSGLPEAAADPGTGMGSHSNHAHGPAPESTGPPAHDTTPGKDFEPRDATLGPLPAGRVHRHTFTVEESVQEVAPGVKQVVWTYNGTAPGPVLHGRVGDRFEITLVNKGTMGHSIDFHAGALAPDRPMRTIAPGESLRYVFTATRAGIWMYHCSTMPMATHIAAGLHGAVIIEPHDLPPVDRSYVLVQSEQYHGEQGGQVDVDKINAEQPDAIVFNGHPFQYDEAPLEARVGERVRIWLLDSGPSRPTSFHVVGGQFDRVWSEGAWRLGSASAPAVGTGAQALALQPAQGGFVELTFPEAGHYPFVSHIMVDAERGAHGVFDVTR